MTIKIGSNLASLNAQRKLGEAEASLSKVFERLSSGQRINRASDDAAGLAIADDLNAKSRIYTQAIRNGNDGISLLNIADSAIEALSGVVTRIRELSEQAANGTYSSLQRSAIDAEAQALSREFSRITQATSFNGINLFDGSLSSGLSLQLGIGIEGSISISAEAFSISRAATISGTGTFTELAPILSGAEPSVALGDLNSDGILDLVTGSGSIRLGLGDGTFSSETLINNGLDTDYAVSLGDLDEDGILDAVFSGQLFMSNQGFAVVMLGNGDGTFSAGTIYSTESSSSGNGISTDLALADLNGDGILDLVSTGNVDQFGLFSQGQLSVLLGNGDGSFDPATVYSDIMYTNWLIDNLYSGALTVGDVNGDGELDIIATGATYDYTVPAFKENTVILLGNGDGTFNISGAYQTADSGNVDVVTGDLNGDGNLDIVTSGYNGTISVLTGNGDGTFAETLRFTASAGTPYSVALQDLDYDGILDLLVGDNLSIYTFTGNGDGTFEDSATYATGFAVNDFNFADLNGDGVADLVAARDNGLSLLLAETAESGSSDPLGVFSLRTQSAALESMQLLDAKIESLANQRGIIGSSQSRISIAISNLQSSKENFLTAESRIRDADIATDSAALIRTQILQQAAASVLSQANQQPQLALQLLR